jgi:hypothetical protein
MDIRECNQKFPDCSLQQELQMVQFSATRCSCIVIFWASLVSLAAVTLCVASQRVIQKVSVYFVIDSVRKLFDTPSYISPRHCCNYFTFCELYLKSRYIFPKGKVNYVEQFWKIYRSITTKNSKATYHHFLWWTISCNNSFICTLPWLFMISTENCKRRDEATCDRQWHTHSS